MAFASALLLPRQPYLRPDSICKEYIAVVTENFRMCNCIGLIPRLYM